MLAAYLHVLLLLLAAHTQTGAAGKHKEAVRVWAVSGGRAELPCPPSPRLPDDPPVLVLWYKESNTLPVYSYDARAGIFEKGERWSTDSLSGRAFFTTLTRPPALVLNPAHPQDQGAYMCRVDYRLSPSTTKFLNLTVAIPPAPPVLLSGGVAVLGSLGPLREGARVEVSCRSVGGRPSPVVTWWRRGTKLPDQTSSTITDPASGLKTVESKVVVKATRKLQDATLTCHAQTPSPRHAHARATLQPRSASVTLNITLPPLEVRIIGAEVPVSAGATLRLVCHAAGSQPPAHLNWWHGHSHLNHVTRSLEEGGNVTMATLTMVARRGLDGATLACTAMNPLLQDSPLTRAVKLKVFYTPVVQLSLGQPLVPSLIKEGDDVFFECSIRANPAAHRIRWYHNGGGVKHNVGGGVVVAGLSLAVQGVRRHHSGSYTCTATNTEGTNTSNPVHLVVRYAPMCAGGVNERTQLAGRGNPVVVWCRVEAQPTQGLTWTWERQLHDGTVMAVPDEKVMKEGLASSVVVTPISPGDYGDIVCRATTIVGRQRQPCVVTLVPAGPPDPPLNCSVTHTITSALIIITVPALAITCLEGYDGGLPQKFMLEAWQDGEGVANVTSEFPEWVVEGLAGGEGARVSVTALNAHGHSAPLLLQIPQASARHHAPEAKESESEGVGMPTMLGAAVGAGAVLILLMVVGCVVVQHTHPRHSTKMPHKLKVIAGADVDMMWESHDHDPDLVSSAYTLHPPSLASLEYTHTQSLVDVHTQTLTPTFLPSQSHTHPTIHLNGRIVNGHPKAVQVETACQASDTCSELSCESEPESVIEVIKLSPATRARLAGMTKGYNVPAYVAVSTKESSRGEKSGVHHHSPVPDKALQPRYPRVNTHVPPTDHKYRGSPRTYKHKRRKLPRIHKGKVVRFTEGEDQVPQDWPPQNESQAASQPEAPNNSVKQAEDKKINNYMLPPPKPPRTISQTSIASDAVLPLLCSNSCPSGFSPCSPADKHSNGCEDDPKKSLYNAPLAEDEVRDAYCSSVNETRDQTTHCHNPKYGLIESDM